MIRSLSLLAIIFVILSLSGCGIKKDSELPQIYTGYTASFIYAKAHQQMQNKEYLNSVSSYKSLIMQHQFTPLAEKGMVDLIYVYYLNDEIAMSLALAEQFIKMYPYSKFKGYVYYMIGVINFENGRGFLQTYGPYDMPYHDPSSYISSITNLQKALALDYNDTFISDAKRRIIYMNNVIAKHYYEIAYFYFKRGVYNAALDRASQVVRDYPQSKSTENALVLTIRVYKILDLKDQVEANMKVLKKNYPKNEYLNVLHVN